MDVDTLLCDLDGVVWLAHSPIAGSVEAIEALRESGVRVLFVTNNSAARRSEHETALATSGIDATDAVISSADAAATLVEPDERVLVGGGVGISEAVERRGAVAVQADDSDGEGFDVAIVGLDRAVSYPRLSSLTTAIRSGARFVATNDDATYPTVAGPLPGGGAIVAAVATASGTTPVVAGKPHRAMADAVRERLGWLDPSRTLMVGDRASTDGAFAAEIGCRFALVRSGVTPPDEPCEAATYLDESDLAAVAHALLEAGSTKTLR